jgi:archaeosine synthase
MPEKIKDKQYIMGFAWAGYINGKKFPALINTFSDDYINKENSIEILGENFPKKIYYPSFLNSEKIIEGKELIIIYNGIELIQRPAKLVAFIMEIRKKYGFKKLIYLQGISDPYLMPVLAYLGINIFDDIYIREESRKGVKYNVAGKTIVDGNPLEENIKFAESILDSIFISIKNNTLREIVEKIAISGKALEILRIADTAYYDDFSSVFPSRTPYIQANSIESLNRPDIVYYRHKIGEYKKPEHRNIALFLPCSAKKPYSDSKTHKKILAAIWQYRRYLHELIITSPVGLVPRELENGYPARFYDIPVIGTWYEDEKTMMKNLVAEYMKNNKYTDVILYVPEDLDFIREALPPDSKVIEGRVTDDNNLNLLVSALKSTVTPETEYAKKLDDYLALLRFQFGEWIMPELENIKLINSFHQDMIVRGNKILFVYNESIGRFSITPESGKFFMKHNKFNVSIDDFQPTSTVYAMGINDATPDIKAFDEVIMTYNNELRGTGTALMPYKPMIDLEMGAAIKVRAGAKNKIKHP